MRRWRLFFWSALLLVGLWAAQAAGAQTGHRVVVAPFSGVVNPPLASFVSRAIGEAESRGAAAVVLEMDTPGGLDSSMREINERILSSRVPIVVYVSPPGARAGSAGVYVTYAAHVAAMAPNTNIGSATPVAIGPEGGEQPMSDEMRAKVVNDAVAYIRGLAEQRGRNVEWAEKAVREGANVTAGEAAELRVVDLVAPNLHDLLNSIDGQTVQTSAGAVTLATADATVERVDMNVAEAILHLVSNPTIAYILLSLGSLGLFLELSNPGSLLPGIAGAICLVLAFYALGTLPVNYAGLALLLFGLLLLVADIFTPTHGVLTAGGAIAFILGSLMLFNVPEAAPFLRVSLAVILAVSTVLVGFLVFIVGAIVRSRQRRVVTGREGLIGQRGYARTPLSPDGLVWVDGELWSATSLGGPVETDQPVEVVRIERLRLYVRPVVDRAVADGTAEQPRSPAATTDSVASSPAPSAAERPQPGAAPSHE